MTTYSNCPSETRDTFYYAIVSDLLAYQFPQHSSTIRGESGERKKRPKQMDAP